MKKLLYVFLVFGFSSYVFSSQVSELKQQCEDKDNGASCSIIGNIYYFNYEKFEVRQSNTKAFKYYDKSCELDHAKGCLALGIMYRDGHGVIQNEFKALELYQKACQSDARECSVLGVLHEEQALKYFGKACAVKSQFGCNRYKKLKE